MSHPNLELNQTPEELQALRRLIGELAVQCKVDLSERTALRRFLDHDCAAGQRQDCDPQIAHELRAMLILLFRLEASSSEDIGIEGLRRLWHQHGETLARFDDRGNRQLVR